MENYNDNYDYNSYAPANNGNDYKTVCMLAMIFGIASFFFNPGYLVSIAAIVLGIVGQTHTSTYKNWAMAGWICGTCAICVGFIIDILLLPFTFGLSFCF